MLEYEDAPVLIHTDCGQGVNAMEIIATKSLNTVCVVISYT